MNIDRQGLRRWALVLALAPLAIAAIAGPAQAAGHHRNWGGHRGHDRGYGGGYYAPPPPVYYAPQPRPSPGISLFFPIR